MLGGGNTSAHVYIESNTIYGNNGDTHQNYTDCGDLELSPSSLTYTAYNLIQTNNATGCGANTIYAVSILNSDGTDTVTNTWAYSPSGNNSAIYNSGSFSFGSGNTFGTNPSLLNPVNPGAPSCTNASSVPNCMASVIANFTPQTAAAVPYGYQVPTANLVSDPLFPPWLCNVNLPSGIVVMGCL